MLFMLKNILKICVGVSFFALFSSSVFAVNFEVTSIKKDFSVDDQFEIYFKVNAQGQSINVIGGTIDFSSDLFSVVKIKDGNSIAGKWIEKPVVSDNAINFSCVMPNGYKGVLSPYYSGYKSGKIFSVVFSAKKKGSGYIKISNGEAYLNDGNATKTIMSSDILYINIIDSEDSQSVVVPKTKSTGSVKKSPNSVDVLPPNKFAVLLSSDSSISEGKWFLAFDAKDNDEGVDYYEVYESKSKGYSENGWVKAESPYVLKDQKLSSYVYVKAVDKNGNAKIETLSPSNIEPWYNYFSFWIAVVFGGVVVFFSVMKARI